MSESKMPDDNFPNTMTRRSSRLAKKQAEQAATKVASDGGFIRTTKNSNRGSSPPISHVYVSSNNKRQLKCPDSNSKIKKSKSGNDNPVEKDNAQLSLTPPEQFEFQIDDLQYPDEASDDEFDTETYVESNPVNLIEKVKNKRVTARYKKFGIVFGTITDAQYNEKLKLNYIVRFERFNCPIWFSFNQVHKMLQLYANVGAKEDVAYMKDNLVTHDDLQVLIDEGNRKVRIRSNNQYFV